MKKKRFFIVCYCFSLKSKCGHGFVEYSTNGCYLNKDLLIKEISRDLGGAEVGITNIIEMSKKDYKDWTRKEDEDEDKNRKEDNGLQPQL